MPRVIQIEFRHGWYTLDIDGKHFRARRRRSLRRAAFRLGYREAW